MLTILRNPFTELAAMERDVERIFSEVFVRAANGKVNEPAFFRLPVNVEVKGGKYVITASLAGFKPEEVDVTFADGVLTISAKHSEGKSTERDGLVRQEVVSGNFYRQIPVGRIDSNSVSAPVENGVLAVTLPAPIEPQPVKIAINSGAPRPDLTNLREGPPQGGPSAFSLLVLIPAITTAVTPLVPCLCASRFVIPRRAARREASAFICTLTRCAGPAMRSSRRGQGLHRAP